MFLPYLFFLSLLFSACDSEFQPFYDDSPSSIEIIGVNGQRLKEGSSYTLPLGGHRSLKPDDSWREAFLLNNQSPLPQALFMKIEDKNPNNSWKLELLREDLGQGLIKALEDLPQIALTLEPYESLDFDVLLSLEDCVEESAKLILHWGNQIKHEREISLKLKCQ